MSRTVTIGIDPQDKALVKAVLNSKEYRRAFSRAINKTRRAGVTTLSKTIRGSFHVTAKSVKQAVRETKASLLGLSATIEIIKPRHKGVPLSSFSVNRRKVGKGVGVSVKIRRDAAREIVDGKSKYSISGKGGFKTKSGRVLERTGDRRYPVKTLTGPTVQEMADEINAVEKIDRVVRVRLKQNIEREVAFELSRRVA